MFKPPSNRCFSTSKQSSEDCLNSLFWRDLEAQRDKVMEGVYQKVREAWKKPKAMLKIRTIKWRSEPVFKRIDKPTRIDRARSVGYKAKQGYVLIRTRIKKGGRHRPKTAKGRDPGKYGRIRYTAGQSMQAIAEKRANRKLPNLEVLNSYSVGEDGMYKYYEIILVDPNHPVIRADRKINWILGQRKRVYRGLTSAARKSRGLRR